MRRSSVVLYSCLGVQFIGWVVITLLTLGKLGSEGFAYEVDGNNSPTWTFLLIQLGLGLVLMGTTFYLARKQVAGLFAVIVTGAILLRAIAVFGEPIHEIDFYRYIWDGKVASHGINPYRFEPGALYIWENNYTREFPDDRVNGVMWRGREFTDQENQWLEKLREVRDDNPELLLRVGHQAITTLYPPVGQFCFWLSYQLFGDSILGLKVLISVFDIGAIVFLLLLLKRFRIPLAMGLLYAWNPLPIKEMSNSAHYDAVAVFFIVLSLWVFVTFKSRLLAIAIGTLCVALGTLGKYFVILVLPVLLIYRYEKDKPELKELGFLNRFCRHLLNPWHYVAVVFFIGIGYLAFLPYSIWNGAGWTEVFRGLLTYQANWRYSPGWYEIVFKIVGQNFETVDAFEVAKKICLGLLCLVVFCVGVVSKLPVAQKCFLVMAALFTLSPTAFPWYYTWVLVLVPFQKKWSWVVLSLLLPINYIDFHSLNDTPLARVVWPSSGGHWRFYATQLISWGIFVVIWLLESIPWKRFSRKIPASNETDHSSH